LPVCALDFDCLHELVKDGVNGLVFKDAAQLAEQFESLLVDFPTSKPLETLKASMTRALTRSSTFETSYVHVGLEGKSGGHWEWNSWDENWRQVVRPLILSDVKRER